MAFRPTLYQVNIRVTLTALSKQLGRRATLDDISDELLDDWALKGFDWIWLLSIWQVGDAGVAISRSSNVWREEFQKTLPDLVEEDIGGSGFAIQAYVVSRELGSDAALVRLRERMRARGLKLMLDFVPNHMAPDHAWVEEHPEYFVQGTENDLPSQPQNYRPVNTTSGYRVMAFGRDPYFPGWSDTLQLNYGNASLQTAMQQELIRIATLCDGVRCDMAMLILPEIFHRTWGIAIEPFWPMAIRHVRELNPEFVFMAEVYWDFEWELQQQGFDFCYDKRLYDRLRDGHAGPVREHLIADLHFQNRLARFLENHDEPRAAHEFAFAKHRAAALLTYLTPGLKLFHQGQLEGKHKRISPHLVRGPEETIDPEIQSFYQKLLKLVRLPVVKEGEWQLLNAKPNRVGNSSNENTIAMSWKHSDGSLLVVVVNMSETQSQACVELAWDATDLSSVRFIDLLNDAVYDREAKQLREQGLFVDLPEWGAHAMLCKG
jgi:Alpha amylase, catalytic domain